ncbi:MFS transporter [Streptomyces lydicus]|uniref:hypothetical protein n=1 Tax=Streptomyces lydicus TaxID=47763 RepID=UPI0036F54663
MIGGRLGDVRPHATTLVAAATATLLLLAICLLSGYATATVVLIALLGFFGLGANPVLIALSVRFAGQAPALGPALSVAAFNLGTGRLLVRRPRPRLAPRDHRSRRGRHRPSPP